MVARISLATGLQAAVMVVAALAARGASEPHARPRDLIVFAYEAPTGAEIRVVQAEEVMRGRMLDVEPLVVEPAGLNIGPPVHIESFLWAPNGRSFMYLLSRARGRYPDYEWHNELWVMNFDGTERRLLERDLDLGEVHAPTGLRPDCATYLPTLVQWSGNPGDYDRITAPRCNEHPASLSPDGTRVVYRTWGIDSNALCIDEPDAERTWDFSCSGDGRFSHPAWSPR